jgi:hypothetical protein
MEIVGTVKKVFDTIQVSEKFSKREVVITTKDGMYEQDILLQCAKNQTDLLDGIRVGDNVDCKFNLKGREWTNPQGEVKYFNSLELWQINVQMKEQKTPVVKPQEVQSIMNDTVSNESDLPF